MLVDNRDSYTFNLAHLIATEAGTMPLVVSADDINLHNIVARIRSGEFSHIVISPGPGHPANDTDFAASRKVIEAADGIPLLGVCLGHQGLAHLVGAHVTATTPHHGVVSTLHHSGEGLFSDVQQGINVVRYHSLHVADPLPECLEVHARTSDGTVQAFARKDQPHWGVQFHPESILTENGAKILRNFLSLRPAPTWRVLHAAHPLRTETVDVFASLRAQHPQHFWLDDATATGWSFLGTGAGSLTKLLHGPQITDKVQHELAAHIDRSTVPDHVPFAGGLIGYFAYPRPSTAGVWLRPQSFIAIDHQRAIAHCIVLYQNEPDTEATSLLNALEAALDAPEYTPQPTTVSAGAWRLSREEYLGRIAQAKEFLASGDSYEICLTDTWVGQSASAGFDLYCALRTRNPAPYAAYLNIDPQSPTELLCSSPERFLTVRGTTVETKPIKGTAPRSTAPHTLQEDPKTRAENLLIVDLLRNDLSQVCIPGTVHVPHLMAVETYAHVHQLVSTIRGTLREGITLIDLLAATFPGGSMTGAPKQRTLEIIDSLEAGERGIYSGTIGYAGFDGNADLNIVIRTAVKRGTALSIGAGGAIVWASDPQQEYEEKQLKADSVLKGLRRQ